jgi:hypothetical protein
MKNLSKLTIKKITLRNLDESELDAVAGACCGPPTSPLYPTCHGKTCGVTCNGAATCVNCG